MCLRIALQKLKAGRKRSARDRKLYAYNAQRATSYAFGDMFGIVFAEADPLLNSGMHCSQRIGGKIQLTALLSRLCE